MTVTDHRARPTHPATALTDSRPGNSADSALSEGGSLTLTDTEGDTLRVEDCDDSSGRCLYAFAPMPGTYVSRDQALELYHQLGDWLMATAQDSGEAADVSGAEDPSVTSWREVTQDASADYAGQHRSPGSCDCPEPLAEWERELLQGTDTSPQGLLRAALNAAGVDALAEVSDTELVERLLDTWQGRALVDGMESVVGTPAAETITAEAERAVYGDRHDDYGHPREDFTRTAIVWTGLLQHKLAEGAYIEAEDVPRCMIGVKLARDVHHPKRDNRVDGAGYFLTLDRLETGR